MTNLSTKLTLRFYRLSLVTLATMVFLVQLTGCSPCFRTSYLFSSVEGIVTLNGKPQQGLRIIRQYKDGDSQLVEDSAVTDESGRFQFAEGTRFDAICYAAEPYIDQKILIVEDTKQYTAWSFVKRNYDDQGEIERLLSLNCELTAAEQRRKASILSDVIGICTF